MNKKPTSKPGGLSLWTLGAFLLPAAALVYLFIWSQGSDAFTARTEIQRAALALEGLAEEALQACVTERGDRAVQWYMGDGEEVFSNLSGIPFIVRAEEGNSPEVVLPAPGREKKVWPLPGDDPVNKRYLAYMADLDAEELNRSDLARAEALLQAMAGEQFREPAFQARTLLVRAAFLKHHDRFDEVREELLTFLVDIDPTAAPGADDFPFVVAGWLLLDDETRAASGLVPAMAGGLVPLAPEQLRAVKMRVPQAAAEQMEARARDLELVDRLQGHAGLAGQRRNPDPFALVVQDNLLIGKSLQDDVRGMAFAAEPGIQALLESAKIEPAPGLALELGLDRGVADDRDEIIRTKTHPAGIRGAVLRVLLLDEDLFEASVASRKVFIICTALILILAMMLLGFATFRAVRREVAAAKARTDFMTAVSHELRTPLASIRMFAELLEEERVDSPETKSRFMRLIISNCRRLTAMIENVLDLGRSEKGLLRFHLEEVDLKRLLHDLFSDLRAAAEEEGFIMEVETAEDLPMVLADASALTRAIFNLLDNARKYAGDDKRITIEAKAQEGGALISIQDRGPGIAPSEQERIFQRYQRGRKGEAAAAGAGLGLSLAREAIEACKGTLALESREGEGSTFYIFIPGLEQGHDRPEEQGN